MNQAIWLTGDERQALSLGSLALREVGVYSRILAWTVQEPDQSNLVGCAYCQPSASWPAATPRRCGATWTCGRLEGQVLKEVDDLIEVYDRHPSLGRIFA